MKRHPRRAHARAALPLPRLIRLAATSAALAGAFAPPAIAVTPVAAEPVAGETRQYAIAAGPLSEVLAQYAAASGVQLVFDPALLAGVRSPGLRGRLGVREGFEQLLRGSGYALQQHGEKAYSLRRTSAAASGTEPADGPARAPVLPAVAVRASGQLSDELPRPLAGGQVARGGRVGLLGNKDIMDTPFSTTNYTAQTIEDQMAGSVMAVLRNDPSVRDVFPEGGLGEYFNVRGFSMQSQEFAWNGLFGLVPHNRASTEFLERVEVLRGPGALLYGMSLGGTVGGVVNLVPKRAADAPLTRLTARLASESNLGAHMDVGRRFGAENEVGVRVNAARSDGRTAVNGQSQDRQLGSLALDFRGERLRAAVDAYNIEEEQTGGLPLLTTFATAQIPKAPDPATNGLPGAYAISRSKALIGSIEFDFSPQWTGFAAVGTKRQEGRGYLNNALGMNLRTTGTYTGVAMNVKNYFDVNSGEAGLRGRLRTGPVGHELVLSANALEQESGAVANRALWASNIHGPIVPSLAAEPVVAPKSSDTGLSSIALADTLSFDQDRYLLTLGLRQQRVRTKNFSPAGAVTSRYDEQALTPAVGVVAKPWAAAVSVYANYIEGLSQGGTVSDSTAANFGQVFAPYRSKQLEAGVKWREGGFLNTLSVFQITRPSLIKDNATNTYGTNGQQRNRGIEWTFAGEIERRLRLLGGASYLDPVTTRTNGGTLDGKTALGVPRWQLNLGAEWDTPWLPGLTVGATAIHTGAQFMDAANTQKLPDWTRVDLGVRYATRLAGHGVALRGGVINAFDKHYWSGVWNGYAAVGAPRTVQLSASVDF